MTQSRDPNNVGFNAVYDNLNRQTSQTDTFGDTTGSAFDKESNLVKSTDAKSNFTVFSFDALNRRKTVTDRLNGVTTFGYTPTSQLSALTDAENQSTLYDYNDRGDKTKETYPDHVPGSTPGTAGYGIVEFAYDPGGRIKLKTDQMGDTCTVKLDLTGRMYQRDYRTFANSPYGTIADSDTFSFDRASRMLSGHSGRYNNDIGMGYDFGGRLSSESLTIAGVTYATGHAYDIRGREASISYPNGSLVERTYTPRQQLHQTKYLGVVVEARTYDSGGRHATSTYANGAVTTNAYRLDNLLSSRATTHAGTEQIGTYSYTWDANKNKTGEAITGTMSGYGYTIPSSGGYDAEDRVTAWNRTDGNKNQTWNLSLVGDWNTHVDAGVTQTRTHGPAHEFASVTIGANNSPISYDPKGNMLTRPTLMQSPALNLVWDFDNQLVGADTDGTPTTLEVTFEYDVLNRRVARNSSNRDIVFVQTGQQTLADYQRSAHADAPDYRYVLADHVDEIIFRHAGTAMTLPSSGTGGLYSHRNQQNSLVALTDLSGNAAERYAYTPYGAMVVCDPVGNTLTTSSFESQHNFTGRESDVELALIYFRARWLDPLFGRFLSRDPLQFVDGMSLYVAYFVPSMVDPSGTENHHWFPDQYAPEINTMCAGLINHDAYTTWLEPSDHYWLHHVWKGPLGYNGRVGEIIELCNGNCCCFLNKMLGLMFDAWAALAARQGHARIPDFWTHYYPRRRPVDVPGNFDYFPELLDGKLYDEICGENPRKRQPCPGKYVLPKTELPWWIPADPANDGTQDVCIWVGGTVVGTIIVLGGWTCITAGATAPAGAGATAPIAGTIGTGTVATGCKIAAGVGGVTIICGSD